MNRTELLALAQPGSDEKSVADSSLYFYGPQEFNRHDVAF